MRFGAVDTAAPHVIDFDSAGGGKVNDVWVRRASPRDERGRAGLRAWTRAEGRRGAWNEIACAMAAS
ncbi:MAG: hypothetical protein ACOYN0_19900 [Phycisphaerales bacterium]